MIRKAAVVFFMALFATSLMARFHVDKIFVPDGFDKNDVVQLVVYGHFSDSCYQILQPEVNIDNDKKTVVIKLKYDHLDHNVCIQMLSPFTQTVNLGKVPQGTYDVKIIDSSVETKLVVNPSNTNGVDDFIYAPVEFTEVDRLSTDAIKITLKGRYPLQKRGCLRIVNTITAHSTKDVVVIQPVAELKDDAFCQAHPEPLEFVYEVNVPNAPKGLGLVHVRVLNGNSYNRIFGEARTR